MRITEEEYHEAVEGSMGYCTECDALTREMTEPDAEEYECPACEGETVYGVETALHQGWLEFHNPDDEDAGAAGLEPEEDEL